MNTKNLTLRFHDATMHVIQFGNGTEHLVMIPGLGDGLTSIKGLALPFSLMYRQYAKAFRVTVVSGRHEMKKPWTTQDMAKDVAQAMTMLGIEQADVLGISQGGMIGQYLALDFPDKVRNLVLTVTSARCNALIASCIDRWSDMIVNDQYIDFMKDNLRSMYTPAYCRRNLWATEITGRMKPKSFDRFLAMADACKRHDAEERLHEISCPVLIVAGAKDQVVGVQASIEMADAIPQAQLIIYPDYGHAVYDEAKDFHDCVLNFLTDKKS